MTNILFYVQHLQGVGHVFRAARIVRALAAEGFGIDVAYGGEPIDGFDIPGARIHYLPPVRAGGEVFNRLEDPQGNAIDGAYKARRRDMLLALFDRAAPDILITEAFPFGRRQMRFELLPLIERAKARPRPPLIVGSVRDILQENAKAYKDRETADLLKAHFDHVLVHADPKLVRLERTFPLTDEIADKLLYTGLVAPDPSPASQHKFDVVVSVGGGALGHRLLMASAAAKRLSVMRDARWLIVTGFKFSPEHKAELDGLIDGDVTVEAFLPDLQAILAGAQLSVSRVGYNTIADIYRAGCRAIVVPLSDGIETEQITRAELLAARGLAEAVGHQDETPEAIAAAIDRAMARPAPDRSALDLEGARNSALILKRLLTGEPVDRFR
ncbi:MAG: glycosyltransferase family protein [Rhizobiaceae bacterium]